MAWCRQQTIQRWRDTVAEAVAAAQEQKQRVLAAEALLFGAPVKLMPASAVLKSGLVEQLKAVAIAKGLEGSPELSDWQVAISAVPASA